MTNRLFNIGITVFNPGAGATVIHQFDMRITSICIGGAVSGIPGSGERTTLVVDLGTPLLHSAMGKTGTVTLGE